MRQFIDKVRVRICLETESTAARLVDEFKARFEKYFPHSRLCYIVQRLHDREKLNAVALEEAKRRRVKMFK